MTTKENIGETLKKLGYEIFYEPLGKAENSFSYKYVGYNKTLQDSIVKVWKTDKKDGSKIKAELIVGDKHYKNLSFSRLLVQIDHIKETNDLSTEY
ncbi:MAG: hypothetical protein RXR31_05885 [Thermoproteota archaeon]